ncbi:GNAT family N-acetyltransferase [Streptomyces sp. NPDC088261]|uniref:GNAT family N-acetyltransferase n=1 Tax=Streptomyces sp. NPDC088261 TaxID=3365851 RepID=UPI00382EF358
MASVTSSARTRWPRLPRVVLEIEPDNRPSVAVARAAGFRLTDAPPETVTDKGRTYTLLTWVREAPGAVP